mmetsp:Transcript_35525/g.89887  ORF Transcript_35525/g.89887 Transcript_35525/m.89887 type:complete len:215 (+) Transcript_35525:269-913(+)
MPQALESGWCAWTPSHSCHTPCCVIWQLTHLLKSWQAVPPPPPPSLQPSQLHWHHSRLQAQRLWTRRRQQLWHQSWWRHCTTCSWLRCCSHAAMWWWSCWNMVETPGCCSCCRPQRWWRAPCLTSLFRLAPPTPPTWRCQPLTCQGRAVGRWQHQGADPRGMWHRWCLWSAGMTRPWQARSWRLRWRRSSALSGWSCAAQASARATAALMWCQK